MSLKITGKIKQILEVEKGTSKAGKEYQKINFVIDTGAQYNPDICFQIFGQEKVEQFQKYNKEGDNVDVSFNLSSREFKGKWYHSIDAWRVDKLEGEIYKAPQEPKDDEADTLPF